MTDLKLRDALAERLSGIADEYHNNPGVGCPDMYEFIATRLLESVPGEEELAQQLADMFREGCCTQYAGLTPYDLARFLRSKIGWWVG